MSKRRFNSEHDVEIVRRYLSGESSETIAATILDTPVPGITVRDTLRRLGVELRPGASERNPVVTAAQRARVVEVGRSGGKIAEAAAAGGIGEKLAWKILREAGVRMPRGRPVGYRKNKE